jgi:hypothetical protein
LRHLNVSEATRTRPTGVVSSSISASSPASSSTLAVDLFGLPLFLGGDARISTSTLSDSLFDLPFGFFDGGSVTSSTSTGSGAIFLGRPRGRLMLASLAGLSSPSSETVMNPLFDGRIRVAAPSSSYLDVSRTRVSRTVRTDALAFTLSSNACTSSPFFAAEDSAIPFSRRIPLITAVDQRSWWEIRAYRLTVIARPKTQHNCMSDCRQEVPQGMCTYLQSIRVIVWL